MRPRSLIAVQAVLGVPVVLWLFFAKPVSLKTVRGAEEAAVSSLAGTVSRGQSSYPAHVGMWPACHGANNEVQEYLRPVCASSCCLACPVPSQMNRAHCASAVDLWLSASVVSPALLLADQA